MDTEIQVTTPEPKDHLNRDREKAAAAGCAPPPAKRLSAQGQDSIVVRGARVHNLKNIDCEIPHNQLTVVTGVSGSGKSSLAFDTLYAEGQRRYVESLSAYARQFLERMEKPDADEISGIAPAVAIRQKNSTRNPRSTVATATEIYDYLRLLFARAGVTICPNCGEAVQKDTIDEIASRVLALEPGRRFQVIFPLKAGEAGSLVPPSRPATPPPDPAIESFSLSAAADSAPREPLASSRSRKKRASRERESFSSSGARTPQLQIPGNPQSPQEGIKQRLFSLRQRGFNRLFQEGRLFEFSVPESLLEVDFAKPVFVLVDRLAVGPEIRQRLIDSVEICFREAGETILEFPPSEAGALPMKLVFNERFECKKCGTLFQEPEPRLFSFNNPFGACPRCQGFGNTIDLDLERVIPDKSKSLNEGAIEPWTKPRYRELFATVKRLARSRGIPLNAPFRELTEAQKKWLIEGGRDFPGVRGFFDRLEHKKYKLHIRVFLSRYRGYTLCPECHGGRLRQEALSVHIEGRNITEICRMPIVAAHDFFKNLRFTPVQMAVAEKILEEIRSRLRFLEEAGLEYLTLDRLASTLSGGEAQRIQLATSLGSNLVGALYVLDEPSIGLHARDTHRLIRILKRLRDLGNTILVVEHDPAMMREADKILDLGPGAGEHGGQIIYQGDLAGLMANSRSLTGRYLSGELHVPLPRLRRKPEKGWLKVRGARQHNLKAIDAAIPLGTITCISGVSGSGKSTLVHNVLYNALRSRRGLAAPRADYDSIEGDSGLTEIVLVDQSPLGRTPRSNPITYLKAFDEIRALFAATPEARKHGYTPGYFSFNVPGGRCEVCQGDGTVTVEMQFLADVELVCEECRGRRFKSSVLEIRYKGRNIFEVLQMTVREALTFFAGLPKVTAKLRILEEIGLGYLRLGQSATTLSGGEAQRVRLAAHLGQQTSARALFIFDEPTTGLHFDDINKLIAAFNKLVDSGATVLIIEHNLDVLKSADWMIDLGPEGGEAGGQIVAAGPPEAVAKEPASATGKFLAPLLAKQ
ncbi:MAG TPA: excinuclease ABC subunit UvrA [Terriglobia bacterium]|nr:excinuclease ABC subunit UvrA [Terriglobia bacterium]